MCESENSHTSAVAEILNPRLGRSLSGLHFSPDNNNNRFQRCFYWKMTLRNEMNNPRWEVLTAALLKTQILAEFMPCLAVNTYR